MSAEQFKELLEKQAAQGLITLLRSRGRLIEDVAYPDLQRRGRPQIEGKKTVDLTFREDGLPVCVEVIELHESQRHALQNAEMTKMIERLQAELGPRIKELNGHAVVIDWSVRWLPRSKKVVREGLDVVRQLVLDVAPSLHVGDSVELEPKPSFIAFLEASCWDASKPIFGFTSSHEEQTPYVVQVAESIAEHLLTSRKVEQLKDCSDARVVGVDRVMVPMPDLLRAALQSRTGRIPSNWTAIYLGLLGEDRNVVEVWRR